ncbi:MAG: hypothetical protein RLZZ565_507 [Planctomycetota bacterium]|jgi:uncharacterized protein YcaQ
MAHSAAEPELVSARDARWVLLNLQGLGRSKRPRSSPRAVESLVDRLGYVQLDSINVLDRAHHLTISTRLDDYRPAHLSHLLERSRTLFEHWTHDACAIPSRWFPHWKHRFRSHGKRIEESAWWSERLGRDPANLLRSVIRRLRSDGPLRTRDLERPRGDRSEGWWEWHPEKAAIEHLWRIGRVGIARRDGFEKVYDLIERVLPEWSTQPRSSSSSHVDWACREAIERLGLATPREIAAFFDAVTVAEAKAWSERALKRGDLVRVRIEREPSAASRAPSREGLAIDAVARRDWRRFVREPHRDRFDLLCPFDPVIRDRARVERLFGFEYRFEAYTPEAKRRHGYYVLPLLEGDRLVGRVDPSFDRRRNVLRVRGPWWEPAVAATLRRRRLLSAALDRLAARLGAGAWELEHPD